MAKRFSDKKKTAEQATEKNSVPSTKPGRTPLWQAILLPIAAVLIFFLLLEGGLALFGTQPGVKSEDPFVGFSSQAQLFIPGDQGRMATAQNKLSFFNYQEFPREKAPGTYRIFTLGGSTTYGRPYTDPTSFSGWLRELLPHADRTRQWEVINAGGISYASYRVAHLMEELVRYQPDLFIVYTGHNEFLEERTYGEIREMSPLLKSTAALLSRTRTWTAMAGTLREVGLYPEPIAAERDQLSARVNTILDSSAGLERYSRDEPLQARILNHYRLSLQRMVGIARSAGAEIIFVTPASSLKDCRPFKSEHSADLSAEERQRVERLLERSEAAIKLENWPAAQDLLQEAVALDPRHALLQYRYGQVLLALERYPEAAQALRRARDEDVCPLRALTSMLQVLAKVASEEGVPLVDYIALLEGEMQKSEGHAIPGQEFFLDHVHPTIEGHRLLALKLLDAMAETGQLQFGPAWNEAAVARVKAEVMDRVDRKTHSHALANLARVLLWAGKAEDAARIAREAHEQAEGDQVTLVDAASILSTVYLDTGQQQRALDLMYSTLEQAPGALEIRLKLGQTLLNDSSRKLEEAAAHLLLLVQQMPDHDTAHASFALAMAKQGRLGIAYDSVTAALRLNPKNTDALAIRAKLEEIFRQKSLQPQPHPLDVELEGYPSLAPRQLTMFRRSAAGQKIPHGILVQFHENGRVKRFLDIVGGRQHGAEKIWNEAGVLVTHLRYERGEVVEEVELEVASQGG